MANQRIFLVNCLKRFPSLDLIKIPTRLNVHHFDFWLVSFLYVYLYTNVIWPFLSYTKHFHHFRHVTVFRNFRLDVWLDDKGLLVQLTLATKTLIRLYLFKLISMTVWLENWREVEDWIVSVLEVEESNMKKTQRRSTSTVIPWYAWYSCV